MSPDLSQVFYIVFVAMATPVGVTIGLVVTEHVDATSGVQTLVIGILQVLYTFHSSLYLNPKKA